MSGGSCCNVGGLKAGFRYGSLSVKVAMVMVRKGMSGGSCCNGGGFKAGFRIVSLSVNVAMIMVGKG